MTDIKEKENRFEESNSETIEVNPLDKEFVLSKIEADLVTPKLSSRIYKKLEEHYNNVKKDSEITKIASNVRKWINNLKKSLK